MTKTQLLFYFAASIFFFLTNASIPDFCDHEVSCNFGDEFTLDENNNEVYTPMWEQFMNDLDTRTFEFGFSCTTSSGEEVRFDYTTDTFWEIRSNLYIRHLNKTNDCFCSYDDCDVIDGDFKSCMALVRQDMISNLGQFSFEIYQESVRLSTEVCNT